MLRGCAGNTILSAHERAIEVLHKILSVSHSPLLGSLDSRQLSFSSASTHRRSALRECKTVSDMPSLMMFFVIDFHAVSKTCERHWPRLTSRS